MHRAVFNEFDEICRAREISGAVLEVGATPDDSTLLNLPSLSGAHERIGINLSCESRYREFSILKVDANDMRCFPDHRFDVVLCNAVLEHDRFFWKTLAEIRRVTRVGGLIVIGAPGYGPPRDARLRRVISGLSNFFGDPETWSLQHSTFTLRLHNFPGDYYRFSEQAFREVFFEGMRDVKIRTVLSPPRFVGSGIRA